MLKGKLPHDISSAQGNGIAATEEGSIGDARVLVKKSAKGRNWAGLLVRCGNNDENSEVLGVGLATIQT